MAAVKNNESGFTLLEVLIALTILAIAATGLVAASRQSLAQANYLETKTIAYWVAENRLNELRIARGWPEISGSDDIVSMSGREWKLHVAIESTPNPDMRKIEVAVTPEAMNTPIISLVGFLGRY